MSDKLCLYFRGLDPKFNYLAQDKDGAITAYTHKPYKDGDEWCMNFMVPNADCQLIKSGHSSVVINNWEDSLIKRGE